jgi:hypothetical protein
VAAAAPGALAAGAVPPVATFSSSLAASCTLSIAEGLAELFSSSARRAFCATSGSVAIKASASSASEYTPQPIRATRPMLTTAAPIGRGRRQRCNRSTVGASA